MQNSINYAPLREPEAPATSLAFMFIVPKTNNEIRVLFFQSSENQAGIGAQQLTKNSPKVFPRLAKSRGEVANGKGN